jgi:subtilisin-like proprotein convertase family protein
LQSPAGTIVTITTDNGGTLDDVFNGTQWDEQALGLGATVADRGAEAPVFVNGVPMATLNAEGRMSAFRGENPNGVWTLSVIDDTSTNLGTVNSWSLDVTTLASAPAEATTNFSNVTPLPILDVTTQSSTIAVAGLGTYLDKVTLYTQITHTYGADLDITLTSPAGTVVKVTTDNGGSFDNVYGATLFDPGSTVNITDYVFVNLVAAPVLGPEGSFENFVGQDPNGVWTLTITDDLGADVGNMSRWDLNITTTAPPTPAGPTNFAGTGGPIPDPAWAVRSRPRSTPPWSRAWVPTCGTWTSTRSSRTPRPPTSTSR